MVLLGQYLCVIFLFIYVTRYDWVTSYKVQFSNDSQTWWKSKNHSSGMDMVSDSIVARTSPLGYWARVRILCK